MVLVAGATGLLGSRIVKQLLAAGQPVRALVRDRTRALQQHPDLQRAELITGDLKDPMSLRVACEGATRVISTANAFMQKGDNTPDRVDVAGTRALAEAAREARVHRMLYVSAVVAEPNSIVDYYRSKYAGQEAVRASGVRYTIVRAPAFMDVWAEIVLAKARTGGAAMVFGDGKRPVNFIAVDDLARIIVALMQDPAAENQVVDLRGPEDLTLLEVVEAYERSVRHPVKRKHIPAAAMSIMRRVVRPFNPVLARMMSGGLQLATTTPRINSSYNPGFPLQTFETWLQQKR
jgi:NADH dehydrogenase